MSEFVVYKDHTGWFRWMRAEVWDNPIHKLYGQQTGTREEIGRYPTNREAREVRDLYNQMVHGRPSENELYNRELERRSNHETTD
jgi:hypothetical protein